MVCRGSHDRELSCLTDKTWELLMRVADLYSITYQPEIFPAASHCVWDKVQGFKFLGHFGSPKGPIPSLRADLHQVRLLCIFSQGPHSHTLTVVPLLGTHSLNRLTPNLSPEGTTSGRPSRLKRGEQPSLAGREIRMSTPLKAGFEQIHYFTARKWNKNGDMSFLISLLSSLKIVTWWSWSNIQDCTVKSKSPTSTAPVFPEAPTAVSFLGGLPGMFYIYVGI